MIIETRGLRKEFDAVVAVNDVDLQIPEKEIYALIGPNGAGKTTLMRMVCGLLEPTSGSVLVNGVDVWEQNLDANAYLSFLPDFFNCYPNLRVWEYLDYFAHAYRLPEEEIPSRIDEVLRIVGLADKREEFTKNLSRGMQQRLGIGKSIIHRPRLLVLDEPAAGLDPNARAELSKLLVALKEGGVTILISSHILSELADFSTSVGIMETGRLVRSGSIKTMLKNERIAQQVVVEFSGAGDGIVKLLSSMPKVRDVRAEDGRVTFVSAGTDDELVELHRTLLKRFPIIGFSRKERGIQDIFTKVTAEVEEAK